MSNGEMTIDQLIGGEVLAAPPETTLRAAAAMLDEAGVGLLVVGSRDDVRGVFSERDVVRAVAKGDDLDACTVAERCATELRWAAPTSPVGDVIEEMMESYLRHILVGADDGSLVGIVSMRDLLAAYPT
jgi:CBS domain-containing protein